MTDKILVSSPTPVFMCGEIALGYGAKALVLPCEADGARTGVVLISQEGAGNLVVYSGELMAALGEDGRITGDAALRPFLAAAKSALAVMGSKAGFHNTFVSITINPSPFDLLNSPPTILAFLIAFFEYFGFSPTHQQVLSCAIAANGENTDYWEASCLCALIGKPIVVKKEFLLDGTTRFKPVAVGFSLPPNSALLLVHSLKQPAISCKESEALAIAQDLAMPSGKVKLPQSMTATERAKITTDFDSLTDRILREAGSGKQSAERLGNLLGLFHTLLMQCGTVGSFAKKAAETLEKKGALGAKLSGYSQDVLALCRKEDCKSIAKELRTANTSAFCMSVSEKAAGAD